MNAAPETARILRVFVSSPGDVAAERAVLDEVVESINRTDGRACGVRLELWKWEQDVVPQIGPQPQAVIDAQTPAYDVYLGILAHRFGTPTGRHGSGTEKEFRDALKGYNATGSPWILFYFSDAPIRPSEMDVGQLQKVDAFRQSVQRKGLYGAYEGVRGSKNAFYEKVSDHLRKILRQVTWHDSSSVAPEPAPLQTTPVPSQPAPPSPTLVITGNTFVIHPPVTSSVQTASMAPVAPTQYLAALRQRTAYIDIRGLQVGSGRAPRFPIDELYIPLTTSSAWASRMEGGKADLPD